MKHAKFNWNICQYICIFSQTIKEAIYYDLIKLSAEYKRQNRHFQEENFNSILKILLLLKYDNSSQLKICYYFCYFETKVCSNTSLHL